jgi:hypothetical protein
MLSGLGNALAVFHAIGAAALALFHLWVWARRGYRIPRYIHVMALVAALIGWGLVEITPADAPVRRGGLLEAIFIVLIFPAIVYGVFVLLGGAQASGDEV